MVRLSGISSIVLGLLACASSFGGTVAKTFQGTIQCLDYPAKTQNLGAPSVFESTSFTDIRNATFGTSVTANVSFNLPANSSCSASYEVDAVYDGPPGEAFFSYDTTLQLPSAPTGPVAAQGIFVGFSRGSLGVFDGSFGGSPYLGGIFHNSLSVVDWGFLLSPGTAFNVSVSFTLVNPGSAPAPISFGVAATGSIQAFPTITGPTALPPGTEGLPYGPVNLVASGGSGTYIWHVEASLPFGIDFSPSGILSGTPSGNGPRGPYELVFVVTDSNAATAKITLPLTILFGTPAVASSTLPNGELGMPYSAQLIAGGGTPPYNSWALSSGSLPPGLSLDAPTGAVNGTPTRNGTFAFTATVKDTVGVISPAQSLSITVTSSPTITTKSLPNSLVGAPYTATMAASGGKPPYSGWAVSSGALRAGLTLNASTGAISGTPASNGTFTFNVTVKDSAGLSAPPQPLSIAVSAGGISVPSLVAFGLYQIGAAVPAQQPIPVSSSSTSIGIPFVASFGTSCAWMELNTLNGITPQTVTASVKTLGLSAGTYSCSITFTGGGTTSMTTASLSVVASDAVIALPHFAVGGSYITGLTVINSGQVPSHFGINFIGDDGKPVSLQIQGVGTVARLSDVVPAGGTKYYEAGRADFPLIGGSATITYDSPVTVQALFRNHAPDGNYYEAAVPSSTGSNEFLILFDGTNFGPTGVPTYTGLAIANLDTINSASVSCIARDSSGRTIANAVPVPSLSPSGHWANYLFPALAGVRGTLDCTSNSSIAAIGLRFLGDNAFSSLPIVRKPASASGTGTALPHLAVGGSYVTDFYIVNTSAQPASFSIKFYGGDGRPISLPFAGTGTATPMLSGMVPPFSSLYYEAGSSLSPPISGWGLITADPAITIQTLFRNHAPDGNYYEASVPSSFSSNHFEIPFDGTTFAPTGAPTYTGLAIANLDGVNSATVTCTARDSSGNTIPIAVPVDTISPLGHWANYLFSALTGNRGTLDCTSNTQVAAIGLRFLGDNAFSSLPVLLK